MKREMRSLLNGSRVFVDECRRGKRSSRGTIPDTPPKRESKRPEKPEKKDNMVHIEIFMSMQTEERDFESSRDLAFHLRDTATFDLKRKHWKKKTTKQLRKKSDDGLESDDEPVMVAYLPGNRNGNTTTTVEVVDPESDEEVEVMENLVKLPRVRFPLDPHNVLRGKTIKENIKNLRRHAKEVCYDTEREIFVAIERFVQEWIENDPQLRGHWKREFKQTIDKGVMLTRALNLFNHMNDARSDQFKSDNGRDIEAREKWKGRGVKFVETIAEFTKKTHYSPPKKRIRLRHNLTNYTCVDIPVFTDICDELLPDVQIPRTLIYEYSDRNRALAGVSRPLTSFTKKVEQLDNLIQCFCHSNDPVVPCWENPECQCYQMNMKLRRLQTPSKYHGKTDFSTFEPILLGSPHQFWSTVGFACSSMCSCGGECTNNVTMLLEKKIFKFEVFRKRIEMGFAVRTMTAIKAGTPIMEFTGEVMPGSHLDEMDHDYTYKIWSTNEELARRLPKLDGRWSVRFQSQMRNLLSKNWFINPKRFGNVARTCCHSCEPNVAPIRVFQKGFSPANIRLLIVTLEDVFPGTELTFDYGADYLKDLKENHGGCGCHRIGCETNPEFGEVSKATGPTLQAYYALRHFNEYRRYKEHVLDEIPP